MSSTGYCTNVEQEQQHSNAFEYKCEVDGAVYNSQIGRCVYAAQKATVKVCPEFVKNVQTDVEYILKLDDTDMGWDLETGVLNQTNCTYEVPKSETLFFCPPGFEMSTSTDPIDADAANIQTLHEKNFKVNIVTKGKDTDTDYSGSENANKADLEEAGKVASVFMPLCEEDENGDVTECNHNDFEEGKHIYNMPGKCSGDDNLCYIDDDCNTGDSSGASQTCDKHFDHFQNQTNLHKNTGDKGKINDRRLLRTDFIETEFPDYDHSAYTWWNGTEIKDGANYTFLYHDEGTGADDPQKFHKSAGFKPKPFYTYERPAFTEQTYTAKPGAVFKEDDWADNPDFDFTANFTSAHKGNRVLQVIGEDNGELTWMTWTNSLYKCPDKSYYQQDPC